MTPRRTAHVLARIRKGRPIEEAVREVVPGGRCIRVPAP